MNSHFHSADFFLKKKPKTSKAPLWIVMNFVVEADWDRYLLDTVVIIKISVCVTETEKWRKSVNFVTAVSPLSIKTCREKDINFAEINDSKKTLVYWVKMVQGWNA